MKNIKKILALTLALMLTLSVFLFTSCGKNETENNETNQTNESNDTNETNEEQKPEKVRVIALKGPTGMGMAKLIEDDTNSQTKYDYEFNLLSAPTDVNAEVIKGEYDIAAVPINLASVLYNKTEGELKIAAINTLGVLYMLENGNAINNISDLKGKTIYATGQGSTPEYVLKYVLTKNNIDPAKDVTIEFLADHAELTEKLKNNNVAVGMLPEPNVTTVLTANSSFRVALNMTEEWNKISNNKLIQGCIIVNKKFAEEHPTALKDFLGEYKASVDYANNNVEEASKLIEKAGIVPKAAVAKKALPNCNICCITGDEMKNDVKAMLNVLFEANNKSVGGKLPDDEFYH